MRECLEKIDGVSESSADGIASISTEVTLKWVLESIEDRAGFILRSLRRLAGLNLKEGHLNKSMLELMIKTKGDIPLEYLRSSLRIDGGRRS